MNKMRRLINPDQSVEKTLEEHNFPFERYDRDEIAFRGALIQHYVVDTYGRDLVWDAEYYY